MVKKWVLVLVIMVLALCGCGQSNPKKIIPVKPNDSMSKERKLPKIDHVVIVIEENHSQKSIKGNSSAPFINALMSQGANLMNFQALDHPSQPNYLNLFSGSNQGVTNDHVPTAKFSADNLASELLKKKYTFIGYSEDLPKIGFNGESAGDYARKHNPWVNFTNVPEEVNQSLVNFPKDLNQLPTVSIVIPNLRHDMHDGTIKEGDQWLKEHFDQYVQWAKTHNSLLIVTWDEDDFSQNNQIPTFLVGPMVKQGQFNGNFNHFNLLRTIVDLYGLASIGESKFESPITGIWK